MQYQKVFLNYLFLMLTPCFNGVFRNFLYYFAFSTHPSQLILIVFLTINTFKMWMFFHVLMQLMICSLLSHLTTLFESFYLLQNLPIWCITPISFHPLWKVVRIAFSFTSLMLMFLAVSLVACSQTYVSLNYL